MANMSYDYTYTDPSGYSYSGQVVSSNSTSVPEYNYVSGATYTSGELGGTGDGTYTISGAGVPTTAPAGAVYQTGYMAQNGVAYPSYHYDPSEATYYNITNTNYNQANGMYTPTNGDPPVPAWSGIGLGNEYSYVNVGSATNPDYITYGGGGTGTVSPSSAYTEYDYYYIYPSAAGGSPTYEYGIVLDNGTFGYHVGETISKDGGTYGIYGSTPAPAGNYQAGYTYPTEYYANSTAYMPSDLVPGTPTYGQPAGYGGVGSERYYVKEPGGYYAATPVTMASQSTPITAIPALT
jgi:hypothetical protein